jgi:hypothetical protein
MSVSLKKVYHVNRRLPKLSFFLRKKKEAKKNDWRKRKGAKIGLNGNDETTESHSLLDFAGCEAPYWRRGLYRLGRLVQCKKEIYVE